MKKPFCFSGFLWSRKASFLCRYIEFNLRTEDYVGTQKLYLHEEGYFHQAVGTFQVSVFGNPLFSFKKIFTKR